MHWCMFPFNAYLGHRQVTAIQVPQMTTAACCAHVCVWKAWDLAKDGVMTSVCCKWTSRKREHALGDAAPQWLPLCSSVGPKISWKAGWKVKKDQTSSAFWLCRLGFKVGQLMPGSSHAKWTSLVAVWGGILKESPGSQGCQGNVKESKCGKKETRLVWLSSSPCVQCRKLHSLSAAGFIFNFKLYCSVSRINTDRSVGNVYLNIYEV